MSKKFRPQLRLLENRTMPATFTVSTTADSGSGSLRDAVNLANTTPGADQIQFSTLFNTAQTIALTTGELKITDSVTITGAGAALTTISGNDASRVFHINGAAVQSVIISDLTITHGKLYDPGAAIAIVDGNVTVGRCNITNNTGSVGGGIASYTTGQLTLSDCVFSGNQASFAYGGGVFSQSPLSVVRCTFDNNVAVTQGGGVSCRNRFVAYDSTFSNNSANDSGGAISLSSPAGFPDSLLINSTIAYNHASGGAGVALGMSAGLSFDVYLYAQSCTILGNNALQYGGGILRQYGTGSISSGSSAICGNTAGLDGKDLCTTGIVNLTNCAVGFYNTLAIINADATSTKLLGGTFPFGPLDNNGGPTRTCRLSAGSPLIDGGSNPASAPFDQRGASRWSGTAPDIGALETQALVVSSINDAGPGSLRQALLDANIDRGSNTVTFDPNYFNTSRRIILTTGQMALADSVSISGPGSTLLTIDGNKTSRIFNSETAPYGAYVYLSGVTLTGGQTTTDGGAIRAYDEPWYMADCVLVGNQSSGKGGAIAFIDYYDAAAGFLYLSNCTVANNTAGTMGGGISLRGNQQLQTDSTTLSGNVAMVNGGAVYFGYNGGFFLEASTISANSALATGPLGFGGGGIYFFGYLSPFGSAIRNCTISGNTTGKAGGAICTRSFTGQINIYNSTIVGNSGASGGGAIAGVDETHHGGLSLFDTVVAGNDDSSGPYEDFKLLASSVSVNAAAVSSTTGIGTLVQTGPLLVAPFADLKLAPLAYNGAELATHQLLAGSPLIDAGVNPAFVSYDERGATRVRGAKCDIGAVEKQSSLVVTNNYDQGLGSLRQQILDSNYTPGADTITFDPTYFSVERTITLQSAELTITEDVVITGPGADRAIVSGNDQKQVFVINGPAITDVTLSDLAITHGKSAGSGGGVLSLNGNLNLLRCNISNNSAYRYGGVGLESSHVLTITDCTVTANSATSIAGGIFAGLGLYMSGCTISGNTAGTGGGGIKAHAGSTITDSTISGNTSGTTGGGLELVSIVPEITLTNCTISGNTAASGGGIAIGPSSSFPFNSLLNLNNCTITANNATSGGGVALIAGAGSIYSYNSIFSGNKANTGVEFAVPNYVVAINCAIGSTAGIGTFFSSPTTSQLIGKALSLGPLADNGGPTRTHALLAGSPAIDVGYAYNLIPANDQRGRSRIVGLLPDIGAYEVQAPPRVTSVIVNNQQQQRSRVTSLELDFDALVTLPPIAQSAFALKRQSDGADVDLAAQVINSSVSKVILTFTGGAVDGASLADGRYTLKANNALINDLAGQLLDGNSDGTGGDDYVIVGDPATNKLFRLLGDSDGNGLVDGVDFGAFRNAFNTNNAAFDFDGNGVVDGTDFGQFRQRFGMMI